MGEDRRLPQDLQLSWRRMVSSIMGSTVIVMACAGLAGAAPGQNEREPSFFRISNDTISDGSMGVHSTINGAVIGCADRLATITEREQEKLKVLLRETIVKEGYNLIAKYRSEEFRAELAGRVNALLQRQVATDVFLFGISFSE